MYYQIDERLARLSATIWRDLPCKQDGNVSNHVSPTGSISWISEPLEGPETDDERFFTMIWNSAKPSRWFNLAEMRPSALVTERGELSGDIGFDFRFVSSPSEADGKTAILPTWGID